jgi:hypothetical protein
MGSRLGFCSAACLVKDVHGVKDVLFIQELESERAERAALAAQVEALKQHVVSIEQAERTAHEQAQSAVQELRQEIQAVKARKKSTGKVAGSSKSLAPGDRVPALASAATGAKSAVATGTKKAAIKRAEKKM